MKPLQDCNKPIKTRKSRKRKRSRSIISSRKTETEETANSARATQPLMDPQPSYFFDDDRISDFVGFPSQATDGITYLKNQRIPATSMVTMINCYSQANGVGREEPEKYSDHAFVPAQPRQRSASFNPMSSDYNLQNTMQYC